MKNALVLTALSALAWVAWASPMRPAQRPAVPSLDATAETVIQRLPTCETAIRTRVAEWKASASIACKRAPSPGADCVSAQLEARAEQLRRIRSCKYL